jgi:hypothetical protein
LLRIPLGPGFGEDEKEVLTFALTEAADVIDQQRTTIEMLKMQIGGR